MLFRFDGTVPEFPLCVRSIGHYRFSPGGTLDAPKKKWFVQLFWTIAGSGKFYLGKSVFPVKSGDVFFYLPGEIHDLRMGTDEPWEYRWLTLDHAESARWVASFGLTDRPVAAGECPIGAFKDLEKSLARRTTEGDRAASLAAHSILLDASAKKRTEDRNTALADQCKRLMEKNFTEPSFTVDEAAARLKVHRSTLFRAFLKSHRVTPSRYLQNLRIHRALGLLRSPELQIKEIAWKAGFTDPNYFSRAIREVTGNTPRELRR